MENRCKNEICNLHPLPEPAIDTLIREFVAAKKTDIESLYNSKYSKSTYNDCSRKGTLLTIPFQKL